MALIKTKLHHYSFDTREPDQKEAWIKLSKQLTDSGVHCMSAFSGDPNSRVSRNGTEEVILDTTNFFSDQWNEAGDKGRRVFDWRLYYRSRGEYLKEGHWLEITEEMLELRRSTFRCGFCGKDSSTPGFCDKCIRSEYLEEDKLHLLRLKPVSLYMPKREKLTDAEAAELVPKYREAQGLGKISRDIAQRATLRRKVASLIPEAMRKGEALLSRAYTEAEGYTWLLDNGFRDIDNVIFYDHIGEFNFGWRKSIAESDREALRDLLKNFPYEWRIS